MNSHIKQSKIDKEQYNKCPECQGYIIQKDHEQVCENCGLVIDSDYYIGSYQITENKNSDFRSAAQFVSMGNTVDNIMALGSHISTYRSSLLRDYRKKIIRADYQHLFNKFERYYILPTKVKNKETEYRILKLLDNISQYLAIPRNVKARAAYFYKIIIKSADKILNNISLIAFCLFYASREFSSQSPINIQEICRAFQDFGHRITPKLILRDSALYGKYIKTRSKPHRSEDFIPKLISKIAGWDGLTQRLIKKEYPWNKQKYINELHNTSIEALKLLGARIRGSRNPYIMAATMIYAADRIISKRFGVKKILTQEIASRIMNIPEYSIRDHFVKIFKPFFNL